MTVIYDTAKSTSLLLGVIAYRADPDTPLTEREGCTQTGLHCVLDMGQQTRRILCSAIRLCNRRCSTFDVWDVPVGAVGRGVGSESLPTPRPTAPTGTSQPRILTLTRSPNPNRPRRPVYCTFCNTSLRFGYALTLRAECHVRSR